MSGTRLRAIVFTIAVGLTVVGHAQDARSLAMGGVLVPGPGAAARNPAFAAVPGAGGSRLALPLGLLSTLTDPSLDPTGAGFDPLTLIDRATYLEQFLFTPAEAPEALDLRVDDGLVIDLRGGSDLRLGGAARFGSSFALPIGASIGPLLFTVRPYTLSSGRFEPDADLRRALGTGSDRAGGHVVLDAEAGIALDVAGALPLPFPPELLGGGAIYAGGRVSGLVGLARFHLDASAEAEVERDDHGDSTGNVLYRYDALLARGGVLGGGVGFGVAADLGLVAVTPSETGTLTLGMAVENLSIMRWTVDRTRYLGDHAGNRSRNEGAAPLLDVSPNLRVTGSASLELSPSQLGVPGTSLLLASDLGYAVDRGFTAHAGAEASFGGVAARLGVGIEDGFRWGIGAGMRTGGVGLDIALSSHRSPFTTHQAYGLAAGIAFGF